MTETLLHQLDQASATLQAAKSTALATWRSPCACPNPGTQLACATCPAFGALVQQVQQVLDPTLAHSTPTWLPPATPPPAAVWAQQCCELFTCGYTLTEIQAFTGVPQQEQVRRWLRAAGLLGGAESYSAATRERCVALYQQGWPVSEIQAATGVPGDIVGTWAQQTGCRQRSPGYPAAVRQQCLELYRSGHSFQRIRAQTGVAPTTVRSWVQAAGSKRVQVPVSGRPSPYSAAVRQQCLDLLNQGRTAAQVEQQVQVPADTVRRWRRQQSIEVRIPPKSI